MLQTASSSRPDFTLQLRRVFVVKILIDCFAESTLTLTVVRSYTGFKRAEGSTCKEFEPIDFNDTWFLTEGGIGLHFPLGAKLPIANGASSPTPQTPETPEDDDSHDFKDGNCWTAFTKVFLYTFAFETVAKFDRINLGKITIRTEGTTAADVFKFSGDFTMVLTDNQTFALFYVCLGSREYWTIMVPPRVNVIDNETREKVLTFVDEKLKMSRREEDLTKEDDEVRFIGTMIAECKDGGALGSVPGAGTWTGGAGGAPDLGGGTSSKKEKSVFDQILELLKLPNVPAVPDVTSLG